MKIKKVRVGWGLLINNKVIEVIVGKRKPCAAEYFDGEYHSKIVPVKIIYGIEKK